MKARKSVYPHQESFFKEKVRSLYAGASRSVPINFLLALLIYILLLRHIPVLITWSWLGLMASLSLVRTLHARKALQIIDTSNQQLNRHYYIYIAGTFLTGLLWGGGFVLMTPFLNTAEISLLLLTVAGICSGASGSMPTSRPAFLAYFAPAMLLPAVWLALSSDAEQMKMAILAFAFIAAMLSVYSSTRKVTLQAISLQLEKEDLMGDLESMNQQLEITSLTDALTGIANRRNFDMILGAKWEFCKHKKQPITLILLDIDYFKRYNDSCGHAAGDNCLTEVAEVLTRQARGSDIVARYGGEEFAILLTGSEWNGGQLLAERLRQGLLDSAIAHPDSDISDYVTFSAGIETISPEKDQTPDTLVKNADKLLYQAKHRGRDQSVFSENVQLFTKA